MALRRHPFRIDVKKGNAAFLSESYPRMMGGPETTV
jgi:hypothetical protein